MPIPLHSCPRNWLGEVVVIVASGPSTERVDLRLVEGRRCIAVSHGCRALPRADVLLFGGQAFAKGYAWLPYRGDLVIMGQTPTREPPADRRLVYMRREGAFGLTDDPTALRGSESSVMLAINYAVHRGAAKIVLLGCDGKPGPNNERRVGGGETDTRDALRRYQAQERAMSSQIKPLAERGISIFNCSPGTALGIYPRANLEDAIAAL